MTNDAAPCDLAEAPAITLLAHPPERRGRLSVPAQAGGCCTCCCCCCLHTIGGIVGAAVAPNFGGRPKDAWAHLSLVDDWDEEEYWSNKAAASQRDAEAITEEAPRPRARPDSSRSEGGDPAIALSGARMSAVGIFWLTLLALTVVGTLLAIAGFSREAGGFAILIGGIIILLVLPGIQLGAAFVTLFIVGVSNRPDKSFQVRQLGKLTLGMLAGTAFGFTAMLFLTGVFGGGSAVLPWFLLSIVIGGACVAGLIALSRRS